MTTTKLLHEYQNGNTSVRIFDDGTKIRVSPEDAKPVFPETIDVKITNHCIMGCPWCHECSTPEGKHGDIDALLYTLAYLPAGVELAVGGGDPISHPDFGKLLWGIHAQRKIMNVTVNMQSMADKDARDLIVVNNQAGLIRGVGLSVGGNYTQEFAEWAAEDLVHTVFHVICGVNTIDEVLALLIPFTNTRKWVKVLVLGYKTFGNGKGYDEKNAVLGGEVMSEWIYRVRELLDVQNVVVSFDNLALNQLNIWRFLPESTRKRVYMGDDGMFSMYIDAVKQEYARSSTSLERVSFKDSNILDFFKGLREMRQGLYRCGRELGQ